MAGYLISFRANGSPSTRPSISAVALSSLDSAPMGQWDRLLFLEPGKDEVQCPLCRSRDRERDNHAAFPTASPVDYSSLLDHSLKQTPCDMFRVSSSGHRCPTYFLLLDLSHTGTVALV